MTTELKKPLRRGVTSNVPHGVNPRIIVTLYPHGVIGLREARRRREYLVGLGTLYVQAVMAEARAEQIAKRAARKQRSKLK